MGRQVNFYMLPEDLLEFEQMLRSKEDVYFVEYRLQEPKLKTMETLTVQEMGKSWLTCFLVRVCDAENLLYKYVPVQNYWHIDDDRSPAVELWRCYFDGSILRRGRLYFLPDFYDDKGQLVKKPEDFIKWANSLLQWVRKKYKRDPETGFYIGPHAEAWKKGGGKLVEI
jgi:hypothetical protein